MTHEVRDAVRILGDAAQRISRDGDMPEHHRMFALWWLSDAIRHLSRPDRAIFPKVRRSSKTRPVRKTLVTVPFDAPDGTVDFDEE